MLPALLATLLFASPATDDPTVAALSPPQRRMLDPLRERILHPDSLLDALDLHGNEHVADVGAGPGFFTLRLARRVPRGHVLATDIDGASLAVVDYQAAAAGLHNVETLHVTPADPGLAPNSVDLAFLCQLDHYLAARAPYFRAVHQALKRHGRLVLVNLVRYRDADQAAALEAGFHATHEVAVAPGYFMLICDK